MTKRSAGIAPRGEVERCSVSLCSGGGMGDLGVSFGAGVPLLCACELREPRARMLRELFPAARVFCGDLHEQRAALVQHVRDALGAGRRPWLLVASPPCQGMSTAGKGRLARARRDKAVDPVAPHPSFEDARNRLILPVLSTVCELRPEWVVIENVRSMLTTSITVDGRAASILGVIRARLGGEYEVAHRVLDAADFGVPQTRRRLIIICRRSARRLAAGVCVFPPASHATPLTLAAAIGHLPALDALHRPRDARDPLHFVRSWTAEQHRYMRATPQGRSALHNDACDACGATTPPPALRCAACDAPLPLPTTGTPQRLVRAFPNSFGRLRADRPCPTLTQRSDAVSCGTWCHPTQHRTLSVRELLILSSIAGSTPWERVAERVITAHAARLGNVRAVVGECVPPLVMQRIAEHLLSIDLASDAAPAAGDGGSQPSAPAKRRRLQADAEARQKSAPSEPPAAASNSSAGRGEHCDAATKGGE